MGSAVFVFWYLGVARKTKIPKTVLNVCVLEQKTKHYKGEQREREREKKISTKHCKIQCFHPKVGTRGYRVYGS